MADWAKILLKTGLVLGVMTGIWAVFTQIQFPDIGFGQIFSNAGLALTFLTYWCPVFPTIWAATLSMLGILIALWTFRFATVAVRWLFKVNE